jgi:uncharacterized protein (TIGR04222 family)
MNPLDLTGPTFLWLYLSLATLTIGLYYAWLLLPTPWGQEPISTFTRSPYLLAHLMQGQQAAAYLALVALQDRRLITGDQNSLSRTRKDIPDGLHPLEQRLLGLLDEPKTPDNLLNDPQVNGLLREQAHQLRLWGYVRSTPLQHCLPGMLLLAVLLALGGLKCFVAFSNGHSNIGYLLLAMLLATGLIAWAPRRRVTGKRRWLRQQLVQMFGNLKDRAHQLKPHENTDEILWLVAVFGFAVLPGALFPMAAYAHTQLPAAGASGGGEGGVDADCSSCSSCSSWSSCSSDSGSSSSCSSSSSCGGGGCGGCGS